MDPTSPIISSTVHGPHFCHHHLAIPTLPLSLGASSFLSLLVLVCLFKWYRKPSPVTLITPDKPVLVFHGLTVAQVVERCCPSLIQGFRPSWWLPK